MVCFSCPLSLSLLLLLFYNISCSSFVRFFDYLVCFFFFFFFFFFFLGGRGGEGVLFICTVFLKR